MNMQNNSIIKSYWKKSGMIMAVVVLTFFVSACLDDDKKAVEPVPFGYVSIYHAAPDAPPLDITVDNRRINSQPFRYSDFSGYLTFYTGDREIKITSTGAVNTLVDTTVSVVEGKSYSLFVIDRLSALETLWVRDSAAAPAPGKAMVRFVNLSPDAPALNLTTDQSTVLFGDAGFKAVTNFTEVEAKTFSLAVTGSTSGENLLSAEEIQLLPGRFYTVVVRGFRNPPAGNTNVLSLEIL